MNGTKVVCIDIETGGLDYKKHQLLTIGVLLKQYDDKDGKVRGFELKIERDKSKSVTEEALKVNRINLEEHDKETVSFEDAKSIIKKEVLEFFGGEKPDFVICHNACFDINWLQNTIFTKEEWDNLFGHRSVDTASIGLFLKFANLIETNKGSLTSLMEYFDVKVEESDRHTGLGDCFCTLELFEKMAIYVTRIDKLNEELMKALEYYEGAVNVIRRK